MLMLIDCPQCGVRHEWDTKNEEQKCSRCLTMSGTNVIAIISELRKTKIPGQEQMLRLVEVINERVEKLEKSASAPLRVVEPDQVS